MGETSLSDLDPEQLRDLLSVAKEPDAFSSAEKDVSSDTSAQLGSWIDQYKLVERLGEGGMAVVYLAEQQYPINRKVAIKIIGPGMNSAKVITRFEAERQTLTFLNHPNIAQIYDAGTTKDGLPYFVMEYVKGLPITEYCDNHKLTIKERLRLFQQVCHAIQHAHQNGIIHRDIKPSNIIVSMQDDQAVPKIIDFGIAKAIDQPLTERTLVTEDSQLLGTPEYMSPEQADMATANIDTRTDVFSLGVLLYVLLAGVLPFDPQTLRDSGIENIRKTIRETDPKTPSTRLSSIGEQARKVAEKRRTDISTLAKKLHKELEWIPLKAMRKERAQRYRSASELSDDIENYLKGAPLIAGPLTTMYRFKKFVRRNKALVGGTSAVVVVSLIGAVISLFFAMGQAHACAEAERQARISEAVSKFLRNDLLESVDPSNAKGRELTIRSFLANASASLQDRFYDEPLVEASIRATLGWTYRMLGELKAAEPHLERALQIREEQLGPENPETLDSMVRLGWIYLDQGRFEKGNQLFSKNLEICRRIFGDQHPMTLASMNSLAIVYKDLGRYDEAEQLYLEGLQSSRHILDEQRVTHRFIGNLGQVYEEQGRYNEAEVLYDQSIEMKRRVLGEQHPFTLCFMSFLARVYKQQGRDDEAESLYDKTLEIEQRVLGEQHPYTLWSIVGLARLYTRQANYVQAKKLFTKAMGSYQRVLGREHRDTVDCMNGLAELYTAQHRFDEAESILTEALEISRRTLGDDHPWTLTSMNGLAIVYKEQGDYTKAEPLILEALEGRRLKLGDTHPHTIESWNNLIELYEAWNKPEIANSWRTRLPQPAP